MDFLQTSTPRGGPWSVWVPEQKVPGTRVDLAIQVMDDKPIHRIEDVENTQVHIGRPGPKPSDSIPPPFRFEKYTCRLGNDGIVYLTFEMIAWMISIHQGVYQQWHWDDVYPTTQHMTFREKEFRQNLQITVVPTHYEYPTVDV